jgi:hypothetical protein
MEIYLLFLFACLILGMARPKLGQGTQIALIFGMALLVSIGYFVFRLV